ncbi:MAG TPA: 2OG-Fe(II) oxygenase [Xanthomonadales bacterium]|nr:2OG-Fe(II) oxygenase [Xanthomonadales bacterium]
MQPIFNPVRTEPCFCGSGELFRDCCGSFDEDRELPLGIYLREKYQQPAVCQRWIDYLENQPRHRLMVVDTKNSTPDRLVKKPDSRRITQEVETNLLQPQISALFQRIYRTVVRKAFNRRVAWFETPMVLRYEQGGKYQVHADSDYYDADLDQWSKCMDRDVSVLLYLNANFTGGALHFVNFNFAHQPKAGDLIFFPSDHRYIHEAQEVRSGVRYAISSWAAFRNQPRVMDHPPHNHIRMPLM